MSIRSIVLKNDAFRHMKDVYDNRKKVAVEWKKKGGKVVGVLGYDVPDELVMAADMLPYRVYGDPSSALAETDKYLEFSFPPDVRSQFEKILSGADADVMDYLAISNSTDAILRIYFYIREIKALEPEKEVPEFYFIDWLFTKFRMHQGRNENTLKEFRKQLEKWAGRKITDEEIRAAATTCNKNRELLRKVTELRKEGRISGSEAQIINISSIYMEREKHSELLEKLIQAASQWPVVEGKKVFLTGSQQEYTALYEILEENGFNVISEDHDWGNRNWNKKTNTELTPIRSIVDRYMLRDASTKRSFVSERVEGVTKAVKACGAEAMISFTFRYDDAPSWDVPEQKKSLAKPGVPVLQIMNGSYQIDDDEIIREKIKAFAEEL